VTDRGNAAPAAAVTVTCDDLDDEGAATGQLGEGDDGGGGAPLRVHVAGALPGETVTAAIDHRSPHRPEAWASLREVITPSPHRRPPACRAFGPCGGCVLEHLAYDEQLRWKTERVRAVAGAVPALRGVPVADCVAAPRPLGYRNRSKLACARDRSGALALGAYAPRSHAVVDLVGGCRIAEAPLDDVAIVLRDVLSRAGVVPYDERTLTGDLRHAVLRVNHRGEVLVALVTARRAWAEGPPVAAALRAARPEVIGVVQNVNPSRGNAIYGAEDLLLSGTPALEDEIDGVRLRLSPRAFLQANRDVAALAYRAIADAARLTGSETIVDAYAGVGGIALTLAPRAFAVIGIEENGAAVDDATASAALNGVTHARFVSGDVAPRLAELAQTGLRADLVVLNPPRKGCAPAVLEEVARLAPRTILYLSCDPTTLARDLGWLAARGFRTRSLAPFDMLPHTPHIEVLAVVEFQPQED
jgi:23S rRNA (uracil1939-C5)-methyltransferase